MLSSVSFSVLSVSVQRIIKWDPLNYKTQICLALFLRTYTQRSSLQPQARSDLTRTRIHQSHKTRMKIVELTWQMIFWWRQPIMIPFQSKEALIDEQIRYVQANNLSFYLSVIIRSSKTRRRKTSSEMMMHLNIKQGATTTNRETKVRCEGGVR
ncbi:hypothetical protein HID58_046243 [Brassica napus]|uniref:Uncharacterized protein n=1 Tax=Brassica napus TaxID=3708 RepID=A0ABQ8AVW0_BRANA|nr:hypothetical protein HID58_046243 [Brassica napus]